MAIFERSDTFSHWVYIRDRNKAYTDPSAVSITITDPCGGILINSSAMTRSDTGKYYYEYPIDSSATYGEYGVKVVSTSAGALDSVYKDQFFVMPWTVEKSVRRKTGIADEKDIDDDDLSNIAWISYKEALRDVYNHHYKTTPKGNPSTGAGFDGSNTSFQTKVFPIADIDGDGAVTGYGEQSCGTDVNCWWIDNNGSWNQANVTVDKEQNGEITIKQLNGNAIPSSNKGVFLDYWSEYDSYNEFIFREAVSYLAAHYTNLRFTERDKVTLADVNSSKPIILLQPNRFLREYHRLITLTKKPMISGVR